MAGIGKIDGRPIAVGDEDYIIKGGSGSGSGRRKNGQGGFIEDLAWPSAELGSLPIEGGVKAAFRREIEAAWPGMRTRPGPKARLGVRPWQVVGLWVPPRVPQAVPS